MAIKVKTTSEPKVSFSPILLRKEHNSNKLLTINIKKKHINQTNENNTSNNKK